MNGICPTTNGWVRRAAEAYGRGRPLALLFDYDGTLTPIVRHPSLARLPPGTRDRLRRLAALPDVGVGVISGRALSEVRTMVGLDGIYYSGSGGLEVDLLGNEKRYPETDAIGRLLDEIQDQLLDLLKQFPGTWLERKPGAIAIHFRGLLPLAATCFRYEAVSLLSVVEELRYRVVSEAIEVTPADGWDKGTAVVSILAHLENAIGSPPLPLYFGDAANDVEGMAVALHNGGFAVGVGPDAPRIATEQLAGPAELAGRLNELTAGLVASRGFPAEQSEAAWLPQADSKPAPGGQEYAAPPRTNAGMLLLDSDPAVREELAGAMSEFGWQVWQADTPERATELLDRHGDRVQVALVDLQLPGLQGVRTLTAISQNHPDLLRCFLSAEVSPYMATAIHRLSSLPLFVKPLRAADLNTSLRKMLLKSPHAEKQSMHV